MTPHPIESCEACSKAIHRSRAAARRIGKLLMSNGKADARKDGSGRLEPYPCPHGNGWHLGHSKWEGEMA